MYSFIPDDWTVPERLPHLSRGAHAPGSPRPCAMEAAAWLAGEPWSDKPASVHPVIGAVARWVNDTVDDDRRQSLWPLILASVGTGEGRSIRVDCRLWMAALAAKKRARAELDHAKAWTDVLRRYQELMPSQPSGAGGPSVIKCEAPTGGLLTR